MKILHLGIVFAVFAGCAHPCKAPYYKVDGVVQCVKAEELVSDVTFTLGTSANVVTGMTYTGPIIEIDNSGQIFIDNKPIERLSDPEIRKAMKTIVEGIQQQSMVESLNRQTDYLLRELEKCQNKPK